MEKELAKQFEVSHGYVHAVQKIKDADEGVFEEIAAGTLTIPEAVRLARECLTPTRHEE